MADDFHQFMQSQLLSKSAGCFMPQIVKVYFSVAPSFGVVRSITLLGEPVTMPLLMAGVLMAIGTWLHLTEHHERRHAHKELEHNHEHAHDEHHLHENNYSVAPGSKHRHLHLHEPMAHFHQHFPDAHHRHRH